MFIKLWQPTSWEGDGFSDSQPASSDPGRLPRRIQRSGPVRARGSMRIPLDAVLPELLADEHDL